MSKDTSSRKGPDSRRKALADHVLSAGSVSAADLAELFDVSLMTIHRDLDELERQGIVRKYRGGVTAQPSGVFESNVAYRMKSMQRAKDAIAAHVLPMIEPGMAVMLDDSTTALALARQLVGITPLTVVTNFLEAINLLARERDIRLMASAATTTRCTTRSSACPASTPSSPCGSTCASSPPQRCPAASPTTRNSTSSRSSAPC